VLCQFLVQRAQGDIASMYGVNVGPEGLSAGLATAAAHTPSVFVFAEEDAQVSAFDEAEEASEDEEASEQEDELQLDEAEELEDEEAEEAEEESEDEDSTESEEESDEEEEAEEDTEEESEAETEEESESENEEETASESEDEETAEDEDAAFLQIAEVAAEEGEGEADSEWTTPEYANEQNAITPALIEQRAAARAESEGEWTTPEYTPEPVQEQVEMATAEVAEAAPENTEHDHVEAAFFESAAKATGQDEGESDSEWTTPEYTLAELKSKATPKAHGEGQGESQEEGGSEWQAPEYSDSMQAVSGLKEYAKVIPAATEAPSGILLESVASAAESAMIFRPRYIGRRMRRQPPRQPGNRNAAGGRRHGTVAATPLRYKVADRLVARPRWNRFDPFSPRHPNPQREQARAQFEKVTHLSYDRLEAYCSTRLPELFGKFCRVVLRRFRKVAEGLRYGDRPNQVCMAVKMCPQGSYVRKNPHNIMKRFHNHY